jgi:hypothetical protein
MDIVVPFGIAATSMWALIQALEKVSNWGSERRLRQVREQREAIGRDRDEMALDRERLALAREMRELDTLIEAAQADRAFEQAAGRLAKDLPTAAVFPPESLSAHNEASRE